MEEGESKHMRRRWGSWKRRFGDREVRRKLEKKVNEVKKKQKVTELRTRGR